MSRILRTYKEGERTITEFTRDGITVSSTSSVYGDNLSNVDESVQNENSPQEVNLNEIKSQKLVQLNQQCEDSIAYGFVSFVNNHHYRTNTDDQINMIGQKDYLVEYPSILKVNWKTEDVGYIEHTREDWLKIYSEAFQHKQNQIYKLDQLKTKVVVASTIEQINAINW
jgi:hypothetical protein